MTNIANDLELWTALCNGEESAFEQIDAQYRKLLTGVAVNYLKNVDDAKDVVQDVLLNTFRLSLNEYKIRTSFKNFLIRSTVNKCIDLQKRGNRFISGDLSSSENCPEVKAAAWTNLSWEDFERFISEKLTSKEQKVINLKQQGYSLEEMAAMCNCEISTIKVHIRSINKKLKEVKEQIL